MTPDGMTGPADIPRRRARLTWAGEVNGRLRGGEGLRSAIVAHEAGLRVAVICKSLFGKAHTVMSEEAGQALGRPSSA